MGLFRMLRPLLLLGLRLERGCGARGFPAVGDGAVGLLGATVGGRRSGIDWIA